VLSGSFAQWQLPDTVIYLDALPRTSVGKFDKESQTRRLRRHLPPYNVTGPAGTQPRLPCRYPVTRSETSRLRNKDLASKAGPCTEPWD
jgi:fatty-acyl-CoA synthase